MEFPQLGEHCSESSCKQLDFLPIRCGGCHLMFCRYHYSYNGGHSCSRKFGQKDNVVPECPICCQPIPLKAGEDADVKVGQHIDSLCRSKPAKELKGKVFRNRCQMRGCQRKEVVPIRCPLCHMNFCLTHRHELDHKCRASSANSPSNNSSRESYFKPSALAAVRRAIASSVEQLKQAQNGLSDAEALRMALEASKAEQTTSCENEREAQIAADAELAAALAALDAKEVDSQTQRLANNSAADRRNGRAQTVNSNGESNGCFIS